MDDGVDFGARYRQILIEYCRAADFELRERWDLWPFRAADNCVHEVVGGLLARQTPLATHLVAGPPMWTPHVAPLVLRSMVDLRITLGWILIEPVPRCQQFVLYGLGQTKLWVEHLKSRLVDRGDDPDADPQVKAVQSWIDSQQFHFLTEVNVGNWAGTDLRAMAAECGCEDLYRFEYSTWSAATHNMWQHVGVYNLKPCTNPLHLGGHRVPSTATLPEDLELARNGARYLDDTFAAFDQFRGLTPMCESACERLDHELEELGQEISAAERRDSERAADGSTSDSKSER